MGIKKLDESGRLGFAEGISKIFINKLKNIDRPIRCSDSKSTLKIRISGSKIPMINPFFYVVETSAIKQVVRKNIKHISE